MSSNKYLKVIAQKWTSGRDLSDIRKRNSTRLQESRKSQRSKAINQFRQGLDVAEQKAVKKSAAEEKLDRLKAYKAEKSKKMEEQKKKQKPPFCTVVKPRHTGGTPFRDAIRTRSRSRNLFEFKATLQDSKNGNIKTVASRAIEQREVKKPIVRKNPANSHHLPSSSGVQTNTLAEKKTNGLKGTNLVEKKIIANKENNVVEKVNGVSKENKLIKNDTNEKKKLKGKQDLNKKLTDVTNNANAHSNTGSTTAQPPRPTRGRPGTYTTSSEVKKNAKVDVKLQNPQIKVNDCQLENHDADYEERKKGTNFHRTRLNDEIYRLTHQSDVWSKRNDENIPEHIKDEILVVVGQTKLLLSQKFMDFRNLIDRCESIQTAKDVKVTLQDLEGFWDMMYQQVIQLDRKYKNLQELENNQWQEQFSSLNLNKGKKVTRKRKSPIKKQVSSKFREFLKSKQHPQTNTESSEVLPNQNEDATFARESKPQSETNTEISETLPGTIQEVPFARGNDMEDDSSFYHSANGAVLLNETLVASETSSILPDVQRTINNEKNSRRSSAGLIILRQRLLMKSISSPSKKNS